MAIRQSIDDLPAADRPQGRAPSSNPFVVTMLAHRWHEQYTASRDGGYQPAIPGRRYRASNVAFRCDRQQYYALTNTERSDPDTVADDWRMGLGSLVHDALQDTLDSLGDGWRPEVIVDLSPTVDGSAHADLVRFVCIHCDAPIDPVEIVERDSTGWEQQRMSCRAECEASTAFVITRTASGEHTWDREHERADIVCELKTINGFSFKVTATSFKGPAEGPRAAHVLQGGMAADAMGCDKLVVGYLSLENVSASLAAAYDTSEVGKFAAEWHFSVEKQLRPMLDAEYARIRRLIGCVDAELMPDRVLVDAEVPPGAVVVDPSKGRWQLAVNGVITDTGTKWFCDYCGWRGQCIADGQGAQGQTVEL